MKVQCNIAQHGAITYSNFAHSLAIMKTKCHSMVKLDELFYNMVQSPNLFSIAQDDEIT